MKIIIVTLLMLLAGCATKVVVKDCNRTVDRQGQVTSEYVCTKPGLF